MNISELINHQNVTISVTAADLKEFAFSVIDEYKQTTEVASKEDKRLTTAEAAKYLGKSIPTLWRWKKEGYLVPDGQTGKNPYYLLSSLKIFGKEAHNER